jgi:signal transduction histidine kinase
MAPSSRHLYPEWLFPGRLRPRSDRGATATGTQDRRQDEGAWKVWEWLRAFDRRHASLVDVVLAVVLFVACTGWFIERTASRPSLWFVAALIFPLVFRRRAPMTVFCVIAGVAFLQWHLAVPAVADVALLVALYTVALESEWRLVAVAALILEVGVVLATARWEPTGNNVLSFVFLTGLVFSALLAGVAVRALRSQLDWLAERAQRLELERDQQASLAAVTERARIAREMHDVVSHNIQVMVTLADAASLAQAADPDRAAETMHEVSSTGRQALTDMRRMLGVLREEPAASGGGTAGDNSSNGTNGSAGAHNGTTEAHVRGRAALAPQPGLRELPALVERVRATGLTIDVSQEGAPFELSNAAGLTVYRVVQEALTNALKHAHSPTSVEVRLAFADPDVSVRVTDNGAAGPRTGDSAGPHASGQRSCQAAAPTPGGGHGLAGMAERATAFGGTLTAGPGPAGGWEVEARLRDCKAPVPA